MRSTSCLGQGQPIVPLVLCLHSPRYCSAGSISEAVAVGPRTPFRSASEVRAAAKLAMTFPPAPANENNRLAPPITNVIALLALSVLINYIDRGNLSIAASLLKDELGLSASQLGILLSSFFWTYCLFLPVSGWLVDRFDVRWVMALGFFLWSGATAVTGGLHTFAALLAARLMLGIGESVAYPCNGKILAQYVPEVGRGFANALIAAGV